jgi:hypothetical protein
MFDQFGYGIHGYGNVGLKVVGVGLELNVAFNNGTVMSGSQADNILVGGADSLNGNDTLLTNVAYFSPDTGGTNVAIGFGTVRNTSIYVYDNRFDGGSEVFQVKNWSSTQILANTFRNNDVVGSRNNKNVSLLDDTSGHYWNDNEYWYNTHTSWWWNSNQYSTFAGWQSATGLDPIGTAFGYAPSGTVPQTWEVRPGRAVLLCYNWSNAGSVSFYLPGFNSGDSYVIRNVLDLKTIVASGTYSGSPVPVTITLATPPKPLGWNQNGAVTGTKFLVYVATRT